MDLARMRYDYETAGIDADDLGPDPIAAFQRWLQDAIDSELEEPNAMVVSTVDGDVQPWSRYVLLKDVSSAGFDFYTNYGSHKSRQLDGTPKAALTFGWLGLHRQVNISGTVERVTDAESDSYWAVRTRGSQLGAWASDQSAQIEDREQLTERYDAADRRYPDAVPRPEHWGGWRVVPTAVEFWQGRQNRMHDRLRYLRSADGPWKLIRLAP